jgi:VIT1/CCC1 family predicted Fe2+/Mn2+ transporter
MKDKTKDAAPARKRLLDPWDRVSEALFGIIMVLTFTGSLSVAESDRSDVRTMLIGALGCNIAWGIIDGILYLMGCLNERGIGIRALRSLKSAGTSAEARVIIAGTLPPLVAGALSPEEYESVHRKLLRQPELLPAPRLDRADWLGALAVFLWVFLITFPVTIPFIFIDEIGRAMRVSNGIAVALMFVAGHTFGRIAGYRPWLSGLAMVVLGSALVALTIALGG